MKSSQFESYNWKNITPPEKEKFNYLGIFQSLKLRISMEEKFFQYLLSWISLQILLAVKG